MYATSPPWCDIVVIDQRQTACLAVFNGFHIDVPDPSGLPAAPSGEWAVVTGGSSSVGKYAVQVSST